MGKILKVKRQNFGRSLLKNRKSESETLADRERGNFARKKGGGPDNSDARRKMS